MNYQSLPDDVLERHLAADRNNIVLILEAARRFPRVSERADDADLDEANLEEAEEEIDGLKGEIKEMKGEIEALKEDLADRDAVRAELEHEITRLNTVLDMVTDA